MSSLWYSVVEREGHHQRDSNTWRLVEMTSLNAFNAFLETLLPDTSFLLNVIIHWVLLSMIRAYCCCSSIELWVFFLAKINIFYTSRCLVLIFLWLLLLDGAAPNRPIHAPKSAGNTFMRAACVFFFLYPPRVFSAHDTVKLPSSRTSYPGSHGTHSSPFPTTVLAFVQVAKKKRFIIRLPSLASPCVELVCIHATYLYNTQHAGCEALSAVSLYIDAFVSGFDLDPNEHIRHFFL